MKVTDFVHERFGTQFKFMALSNYLKIHLRLYFALNVIDNEIGVEELLNTVLAMAYILPSSREQ
jgi:hypothetical protein